MWDRITEGEKKRKRRRRRAWILAFVLSCHVNLYLVNTIYLTLLKSSAKLKQLVKQSDVTNPPCDVPVGSKEGCFNQQH